MARELEPDDPRYIPDDLVEQMRQERTLLHPEMTDEQQARAIFLENAPAAAATITQIAMHGTSERVRLDASKYIVERVLGRVGDDNGTVDPLQEFLQGFNAQVENFANGGK